MDDCQGEKFEELLAGFSTSVLRRASVSDNGTSIPAVRLSSAKGLLPDEYALMVPLILSHHGSLSAMSKRRARVHETHRKFSGLLDNKKTQLDTRSDSSPILSNGAANYERISAEVKANWLGSEEWAKTLLDGGSRSSGDAFLELPFFTAWVKAKDSAVDDLSTNASKDLLVNLESRITRQRDRLHRWRNLSDSNKTPEIPNPVSSNNNDDCPSLVFNDHHNLSVASISKAVRQRDDRNSLEEADRLLLTSMNEALDRVNGKVEDTADAPSFSARIPDLQTRPVPAETNEGTREQSSTIQGQIEFAPLTEAASNPSPEPDTRQTGSPVVYITSDPEPQPELGPASGVQPEDARAPEPELEPEPEPELPAPITLAERTRKSMSLIPPSNRPRESIEPRKSRPSFPINQFETPRKPSAQSIETISERSTPRDDLFSDQADYDSVFKSRPRVANSPMVSPAVHVSPLDDTFDLDEDEQASPWSPGNDMQSSPLAAARPRV